MWKKVHNWKAEGNPEAVPFREFGRENKKTLILLHPAVVFWDYFSLVIPYLEKEFHVLVPLLPGYDETNPKKDYTSVEEIADGILLSLRERGIEKVDMLYGCSMGGAIALRLLARDGERFSGAIIDGGITPYPYPWILTRFIALKDYLLIAIGKIGGLKLLQRVFRTDSYTEEELQYIVRVLRFISRRTIWRTFDSCNNYSMPHGIVNTGACIEYWCADSEVSERRADLRYMKKHFPKTRFVLLHGIGHGGMAPKRPKELARRISGFLNY